MGPRAAALHLDQAFRAERGRTPSPRTLAILWAQWALETGRGRHMRGYNFGGLKGRSPTGGSAVLSTREGFGANETRRRSRFRAYDSADSGARDYVRTLSVDYPEALAAAERGDVHGFVDALERRRYFSGDPATYRSSIASLAREVERVGPTSGTLHVDDPGPYVEALLHTLGRVIARRAAG